MRAGNGVLSMPLFLLSAWIYPGWQKYGRSPAQATRVRTGRGSLLLLSLLSLAPFEALSGSSSQTKQRRSRSIRQACKKMVQWASSDKYRGKLNQKSGDCVMWMEGAPLQRMAQSNGRLTGRRQGRAQLKAMKEGSTTGFCRC